ncbi:MAG: DNA repair protein RecO [Patescibacteria group bacterium]|nr:MAG: DNA repair protein RecO [Patescibacteria group bacterium]
MSTYHARAIVLRRETWRDAARLYTLYTREGGKLLAVGRGTRKVLSKLGPHLEPFTLVDLHLARGRKLDTLCGAIMARSPEPLVADDRRYVAASFVAEALDHFVKLGERDEELWRLVESWYADAAVLPEDRLMPRLSVFVWRLLSHLGYHPKLEACCECGKDLRYEHSRFLPARGSAACRLCPLDERALAGAETLDGQAHAEILAVLEGAAKMPLHHATIRSSLALLESQLDRPLTCLPLVRVHLAPARATLEARLAF